MIKTDEKPLIGFFPGFFDIGETYPIIKIAKRYQELGGNVIIFSHGGDYEYLAKEQSFKIKRIEPIACGPDITRYFMTIPEASQLVLEAGAMGSGGEIFIFDMGKSIKI